MELMGIADAGGLEPALPGQMWSIGGGKGGVGKSLIALSLAYWLGRMKRRVILVDADLGAANLHTMLGIRVPKLTMEDFLQHRVGTLEEALLPTPFDGVHLLAGAAEVASLTNPNYGQKMRILRALNRLQADYILVDLGAGTSFNVLDFFLASPNKLVVMTPQPTSIQNAYSFIKSALFRQISRLLAKTLDMNDLLSIKTDSEDRATYRTMQQIMDEVSLRAPERLDALQQILDSFHVWLVVNMARNPQEERAGEIVRQVCQRYLSVEVDVLGALKQDPALDRWAATMNPEEFAQGDADGALRAAYEMTYKMLGKVARAA